jgi:hypothetical protein
MTISVVQQVTSAGGTGSFGVNTTAGNSVVTILSAYQTAAGTITSTVAGGTLLEQFQSAFDGTDTMYSSIWATPNVAGGSTAYAVSCTGGNILSSYAYEVAGLGTTPIPDRTAGNGNSNAGPAASGSTPAIRSAPQIVFGTAIGFAVTLTTPGAPWTALAGSSNFCWAGYQIPVVSGGTFNWSQVMSASAGWSASVASLAVTGASLVTGSLPQSTYVRQSIKRASTR